MDGELYCRSISGAERVIFANLGFVVSLAGRVFELRGARRSGSAPINRRIVRDLAWQSIQGLSAVQKRETSGVGAIFEVGKLFPMRILVAGGRIFSLHPSSLLAALVSRALFHGAGGIPFSQHGVGAYYWKKLGAGGLARPKNKCRKSRKLPDLEKEKLAGASRRMYTINSSVLGQHATWEAKADGRRAVHKELPDDRRKEAAREDP